VAKERLASLLENGPALEHDVAVNLRAVEIMRRFRCPAHLMRTIRRLRNPANANAGQPMSVSGTQLSRRSVGFVGLVRLPLLPERLESRRALLDREIGRRVVILSNKLR
jgi:hypothetical protein